MCSEERAEHNDREGSGSWERLGRRNPRGRVASPLGVGRERISDLRPGLARDGVCLPTDSGNKANHICKKKE